MQQQAENLGSCCLEQRQVVCGGIFQCCCELFVVAFDVLEVDTQQLAILEQVVAVDFKEMVVLQVVLEQHLATRPQDDARPTSKSSRHPWSPPLQDHLFQSF